MGRSFVGGVVEKVLERLEQQRTETTAVRVCLLKPITFEHHDKEILREILGILGRITAPGDESKNRPPIDAAELGKRCAGVFLSGLRVGAGKNEAPARRDERARLGGSFVPGG